MRPTSLAIQGLKCWSDKTLELGPLTAIQGPNGSGKTAIIQALRLALMGYDPETGRQLDKTRKLVSPDAEKQAAEIGLSFDNGFGILRRFGAKSSTQVLPSRGETTGRECQRRIDEETGGLVVSLDIATFFDLSDEKRRAWLFEHLPTGAAELTWKVFAEWTDAPIEELGETEALGMVVRDLWINNVQAAPNAVVGLSSAIETAHREFLEADRRRQGQREVVDRGAELLRTDEEPEPVDEAELQELEERLASTNQRIGETRAGREAREAIQKRRDADTERWAGIRKEIEHIEHVRADVVGMLEALPDPDTTDREEELGKLEAEVELRGQIHAAAATKATTGRSTVTTLDQQRDRVEKYGACPYALMGCEEDTTKMRQHVLGGLDQEIVVAIADAENLDATEVEARDSSAAASERLTRLRLQIRSAGELVERRRDLEQSSAAKASHLLELAERAEIHHDAAAVATAELEALGADDALGKLYEERDASQAASQALLGRLDAVVRYSERVAGHEREEGVLADRVERATALKELDGNLRRLRGHVIQAIVGPLEWEADMILRAMDPEKTFRFYFERGNAATLDLGFEEDGVVRLFDAASKGERVMLTVAFLGALLAVIKPPMRLLVIDDLEQLDEDRRRRLLIGLANLHERWDAVIVAGACQFHREQLPGEWDFVDLAEDVPAEATA